MFKTGGRLVVLGLGVGRVVVLLVVVSLGLGLRVVGLGLLVVGGLLVVTGRGGGAGGLGFRGSISFEMALDDSLLAVRKCMLWR